MHTFFSKRHCTVHVHVAAPCTCMVAHSYDRTHLMNPRLSLKLVVEHKIWDRASQILHHDDRENKNETAGMTKIKNMARLRSSPPPPPRSSAPDATVVAVLVRLMVLH